MLFVSKDKNLREFMIQFQKDMYVYPDEEYALYRMKRFGITFDFKETEDRAGNITRDVVFSQEYNPQKGWDKMTFTGRFESRAEDLFGIDMEYFSPIQLAEYLSKQRVISPLEQIVYTKKGKVKYKRTEWYDENHKVIRSTCEGKESTGLYKDVRRAKKLKRMVLLAAALGAVVAGGIVLQKCAHNAMPVQDNSYQRQ